MTASSPSPFYCLATVSLNQLPLDWEGNRRRILAALSSLADQSKAEPFPDLILFPELCISGYGCQDAFHFPQVWQKALQSTQELAEHCQQIAPHSVVVVGLPFYFQGGIYNCCAALANGGILGLVPKTVLAGDGVHYEPRWFCAFTGTGGHTAWVDGQDIPFGLMAFAHQGTRFIIENCRDAWVPNRPACALQDANFDIILNPSASHFAFDKHKLRRNIAIESSRRFSVVFALTNLLGCEAGKLIYDGQMLLASDGILLQEKLSFSFQDFVSTAFLLDPGPNRIKRARLRPANDPCSPGQGRFPTRIVDISSPPPKKRNRRYISGPLLVTGGQGPLPRTSEDPDRNEQFLRVLCLGLFDYLRRSGARSFVISLSGGADSSACAILVQRMLAYTITELGAAEALKRLGRADLIPKVSGRSKQELHGLLRELMPHFLYTLYQSARHSSKQSSQAARRIAEAVGSTHIELSIQSHVDAYVQSLEGLLGRRLQADQDDLTLQNIQARSRAPMAWLLANATDSLLLTTANRSEIAVGYSTMDGDTAGGLAPIGGVTKSFLLEWLVFMEKKGDALLGPVPELCAVNSQKPSAELRPGQSDEADLMPYDLLDEISRLVLTERKAFHEVLAALQATVKGYTRAELEGHVSYFFELFGKSQWKRERYAPSFYIEEGSLDPQGYFRFPILSRGIGKTEE